MNDNHTVTLVEYLLSFKSKTGLAAGLFSAIPILSKLLPESYSAYGFPPLGTGESVARIGAVVLALAAPLFAFYTASAARKGNRKRVASGIIFAFVCLFLYFVLFLRFVRTIDIPSKNITVQVSVGYERTDFAKVTFGEISDEDLLRARGTSDEEIRKLWTTKSLLVSRSSLYITYVLVFLSLVTAFSWGVFEQSMQPKTTASH